MGRAHISHYLPGVEGLPARAVGGELGGAAHPHPREAGDGPPVQPPHTPTARRGGEGAPHAWGEKKILWWEINPLPPCVTCKACLARILISISERIVKKFWALRLWAGRWKEPLFGYASKNDEKENSGNEGLGFTTIRTVTRTLI